ncbi:MAG: Double zinc ribbon [Acidobacteriota bacterium]|nr:Double zinc ribbon [Acidobacteriota bacterium]
MAVCANCGTSNVEGTKFCVSCGATLGDAPAPESWRASSELGTPPAAPTDQSGGPASGYTPGSTTGDYTPGSSASGYTPQTPPPPSSYPAYTPTQSPQSYQPQGAGGAQPMHPAIPAIVSFFLPGIGLLFVPDKQKLGLMVFGAWVALIFLMIVLTFLTLGLGACLFPLLFIANVAAGIHSWDEAAKSSGGQFHPLLFK